MPQRSDLTSNDVELELAEQQSLELGSARHAHLVLVAGPWKLIVLDARPEATA